MANRGRGCNQDWDPMRDDFDSSNYDPQYPDDDVSDTVQLDHRRLYITNIPKGLNDEGLRAAFAKYGTLEEVYVSRDPNKRYGLVAFETPGEAKHAMMKLNKTEPLKLTIGIAHKRKETHTKDNRDWEKRRDRDDTSSVRRERDDNSHKERARDKDDASVASRGKHPIKMANGDNAVTTEDIQLDMEEGINLEMDPELGLELERIQLEKLRLQHSQLVCKQRLLLRQAERRAVSQNTPSSRCVLPGGKVVVRTVTDGAADSRDMDSNFTAAAGDSLSIPGLQPAGSRACLTCSARADLYCGRCEVAPYCSTGCQRRDWHGRHRYVCHNLAQLSAPLDVDEAAAVPPPTPLRQPHVSSRPTQRGADSDGENGRDEDKQKKTGQNSYIQKNSPNAGRSGPRGDNRTDNRSAPRGDNRSDTRNAYRGDNRNDNRGERTDNRADNRNENRFGNRNENRNDNRNENRSDNRYGNQGDNRNENRTDNRNGAPKNFRPQLNHENGGGPKGAYRYRQQYNPRYNEQRYHNRDDGDWDAVKPEPAQPKPVQDKPVQSVQTVPVQRPVQATPVQAVQATPVQPVQAAPVQNAKPPVNVADVTPAKKIVPKECLIDTLPVGALVLLSADARGAACRARAGLVCLAMHDSAQAPYEALCDQYAAACETLPSYKPTPGETFSYLDRSDGGWYRARCVAPTLAALIDSGKMVPLDANDRCCKLPPEYESVPEFCCLLTADQVQIGDSLRCTLVSKTPRGFSVTLEKVESGEAAGRGELTRWLPEVEYPRPAAPVIPAVARPPLSPSLTLLVDATPERAFVRPASLDAQRAFDDALQAAVLYGRSATPLREPPLKGQVVISKFTDDLHYRALVQRTNARQNKYLIEYIEFGNTHISKLEDLYACPPNLDLANKPTVTSEVKLPLPAPVSFTPAALEYIEKLKDEQIPLMMTLTNGAKSAPSGAEVILTVEKNKEVVHKRLVEMCTPEWKKIEERGGDVVESEHIMFSELEYLELPPGGCELDILDMSLLHENILSGCERGLKLAAYVFTSLTDKMGEYCNSAIGREPYLPKENELCIAKCPPYPQWFRGVVAECSPGGAVANVCFVDYGNLQEVPVSLLRKMLPEFVRGLPAVAFTIEVQGFPERPTEAQLLKAAEIMKVTEEGRGVLRVSKCVKGAEPGCYVVEAPELIKALNAV